MLAHDRGQKELSQAPDRTTGVTPDSLFHACTAGICGYFVGLAVMYGSLARGLIAVGLIIAAFAHGLFDYFAIHGDTWLAVLTDFAVVLVFISYVFTGGQITAGLGERLSQAPRGQ